MDIIHPNIHPHPSSRHIATLDYASTGGVQATYQAIHAMKQDNLTKEQMHKISNGISDDAKRVVSDVATQYDLSI